MEDEILCFFVVAKRASCGVFLAARVLVIVGADEARVCFCEGLGPAGGGGGTSPSSSLSPFSLSLSSWCSVTDFVLELSLDGVVNTSFSLSFSFSFSFSADFFSVASVYSFVSFGQLAGEVLVSLLLLSDSVCPCLLTARVPRLWLGVERVTTLYTTSDERLINSPWIGLILSVPLVSVWIEKRKKERKTISVLFDKENFFLKWYVS